MKQILISIVSLIAIALPSAFAGELESLSCEEGDYRVEVSKSTIGGKGKGQLKLNFFTLYHKGELVTPMFNKINLAQEGFEESFLNSYVWVFDNDESMIAVAVPGLKDLTPGVYTEAKADLAVTTGGHVMTGSTVDCVVTIK